MKIYQFIKVDKKELRSSKGQIIARALKTKQKNFVNNLEEDMTNLDMKIANLEEIDVNDFQTDTWIEDYNDALLQKEVLKTKLKTARKIYTKLFSEDKKKEEVKVFSPDM